MRAARMASSRVKGAWLGGGVGVGVDGSFEVVWVVGGDMVVGGARGWKFVRVVEDLWWVLSAGLEGAGRYALEVGVWMGEGRCS